MLRPHAGSKSHRLRCPACGEAGDIGPHARGFEPRGAGTGESRLHRCMQCGCGVAVSLRRVARRLKVEQVDPDEWARLERAWERQNSLPAIEVAPPPSAEELVREMRRVTSEPEHIVHLVAEALERPHDEVRGLLAEEL